MMAGSLLGLLLELLDWTRGKVSWVRVLVNCDEKKVFYSEFDDRRGVYSLTCLG